MLLIRFCSVILYIVFGFLWQVPAEPGPDPGRGATARHWPQEVRTGRESPLPLQWPRGRAVLGIRDILMRTRIRLLSLVILFLRM
jgi:hypothetical protein